MDSSYSSYVQILSCQFAWLFKIIIYLLKCQHFNEEKNKFSVHIWKPTCLFLSIFMFHSEWFWNSHVSSLFFNKRHIENSVDLSCFIKSFLFLYVWTFSKFKMKKTINRKIYKYKPDLLLTYKGTLVTNS